jgi:hypothetical protein
MFLATQSVAGAQPDRKEILVSMKLAYLELLRQLRALV